MTDPIISPLVSDSPFQKSGQEIEDIQFRNADKRSINGIKVIADSQVNPDYFVREMIAYIDKDGNSIYEEGIDELSFSYNVKIFISKDDSYLRKLFENVSPADNEVCLFLEDQTGDIFSGKSSYVKIGENFREDLKKRKIIGEGQAGLLADETFHQHFQDVSLDFTNDEIQELIETGQIADMSRTLIIGLLQLLYLPNIILEPLFKWVADGISSFTGLLKKTIKFQPHHWDPEAKVSDPDDTTVQTDPAFKPALFPFAHDIIDDITNYTENETTELIETVKKFINEKEQEFITRLDEYIVTLENNKDFMGKLNALADPTKKALEFTKIKVKELVENMLLAANSIFKSMTYLGKRMLNTINAFYCGLWNGLMDSIIGIIDLTGLLFRAFAVQAGFLKNAQTKIPQAFEMLDECIQAFSKIDLGKIASEIADQIMRIDITAFAGKISIEKIAYFFGAVVGFIVEIIVGIFLTGGVEAVYATINKLITNSVKLIGSIQSGLVKFFGRSLSRLKDDIMHVIAKIIEFLKKGTEGVIETIRALFREILNTVKITAELLAEIVRMFKLSKSDLAKLDEMGYGFVSLEKGVARACKLIRAT